MSQGSKMPFGQLMSEFGGRGTGGWVPSVCFSISWKCLAYVRHDVGSQYPKRVCRFQLCNLSLSLFSKNDAAALGREYYPLSNSYHDRAA